MRVTTDILIRKMNNWCSLNDLMVEQGTENPRVTGSIPVLGTKKRARISALFFSLFASKLFIYKAVLLIVRHG